MIWYKYVSKVLNIPIRNNENALLARFNPNALDDISYLEEDLIADFKAFSREYDSLARSGRVGKKFIHSQSVLLCLLRRRGHDPMLEHLSMAKTKDVRENHDDVCRLVFERLGWEV